MNRYFINKNEDGSGPWLSDDREWFGEGWYSSSREDALHVASVHGGHVIEFTMSPTKAAGELNDPKVTHALSRLLTILRVPSAGPFKTLEDVAQALCEHFEAQKGEAADESLETLATSLGFEYEGYEKLAGAIRDQFDQHARIGEYACLETLRDEFGLQCDNTLAAVCDAIRDRLVPCEEADAGGYFRAMRDIQKAFGVHSTMLGLDDTVRIVSEPFRLAALRSADEVERLSRLVDAPCIALAKVLSLLGVDSIDDVSEVSEEDVALAIRDHFDMQIDRARDWATEALGFAKERGQEVSADMERLIRDLHDKPHRAVEYLSDWLGHRIAAKPEPRELDRWEVRYIEIADALGLVNRGEGTDGFEVAPHERIMEAVRDGKRALAESDEMFAELQRLRAERDKPERREPDYCLARTALNWKTAEPHVVNTSWGVVNGPCVSVQTTRNLVERTALFLYPRIQPGDLIWFKEAWCIEQSIRHPGGGWVHYRSDNDKLAMRRVDDERLWDMDLKKPEHSCVGDADGVWRSSMLMPRWAARDTCTVLEVVPRRPCDLTDEEKSAEGFPLPADDPDHPGATFEEFFADLHKAEIHKNNPGAMTQWCWFYRIAPYGEKP